MNSFSRYELRTIGAPAARAFYDKLFGHSRAVIWPLHEQALANGARPHWLGHIDVADPEATATEWVRRGATRFGPTRPTADGGLTAVLRDPGGALVAVATPPRAPPPELGVGWHILRTRDLAAAVANHRELYGWATGEPFEVPGQGHLQPFAWRSGEANVGAMAGLAEGVHPQWLYFFDVEKLDDAIAHTRAAGGVALEPIVLPGGERLCVCDDPQGAAFGLRERRG